ncbi:MAG TPA: pseudaminic acid synthase [Candidatus Paceibacterota bacterium]
MKSVFIIAELSGNHHQKLEEALRLIDAAAAAGVDAVKTQTYTADTITIDSNKKYFQVKVNNAWKGQTLYSLYQKAYTPWEWLPKMKARAQSRGLAFFSSVFDASAVDFMEKLGVDFYKVASFEVVDIPLLERIGKTKKPVIMSKGMATAKEIRLAMKTLRQNGCPKIALLQCVSSYPAKPEEMNLLTIPDIARRFKVTAGLSDHTLGNHVAVAAVALGAKIIEKHLTLRRVDGGPDAAFSLEPAEFKNLVRDIRDIEQALGKAKYGPGKGEQENIVFRKSLFVVKDVKKGERFTPENVRSIRPGYGLAPKFYRSVLGKKAKSNIERGTPLARQNVAKK